MRKVLFTFILSTIATLGFAQSNSTLRLALNAYPNLGFLKVEEGKSSGQSLGFTYGMSGDFEFAENYSFYTGILLSNLNGRGEIINYAPYDINLNTSELYDVKYKMQYLEIPLALKLKTDEVDGLKWFGLFGFTTNFRVGAKQNVSQNNVVLANDAKASATTRFFRAGIVVGGGAEYKVFGRTSLVGGISYNNGLTNIARNSSKVKNHYLAFNIGVLF